MRIFSFCLFGVLISAPVNAFACGHHHQCQNHKSASHHHHAVKSVHVTPNAMSVSKTGSVTIYRGSAAKPDLRAIAAINARKAQVEIDEARATDAAARQSRIEDRLDAIEAAQIKQTRATQRSERRRNPYGYGRTYRGNNRFFGRNGFIGNSNFSGASVQLSRPVRRPTRRVKH